MSARSITDLLLETEEMLRETIASPACDQYATAGLSSKDCLENLLRLVIDLKAVSDDGDEQQHCVALKLHAAVRGLRGTTLALSEAAD